MNLKLKKKKQNLNLNVKYEEIIKDVTEFWNRLLIPLSFSNVFSFKCPIAVFYAKSLSDFTNITLKNVW